MKKVLTNGFTELSSAELEAVDGGNPGVLAIAATIVAVGGAVAVCYETGKAYGQYYHWAINGGWYDVFN